MNAQEFVKTWKEEHDEMLNVFLSSPKSQIAALFSSLQLNDNQKQTLRSAVSMLLTDTFYTLLLGLDGSASIGGVQMPYTLLDEDGNTVARPGELEGPAYEQFHGKTGTGPNVA